jgi:hypothetical protein
VVDRGGELGGGADEREEAISEAQHDGGGGGSPAPAVGVPQGADLISVSPPPTP